MSSNTTIAGQAEHLGGDIATGLTLGQVRVLELLRVFVSVPSVAGSLFVIVCYRRLRALRSFALHLVCAMAVADLVTAVANMMGDQGGNTETHLGASPEGCLVQAAVMSFGSVASMLWAAAIAWTLRQSFLRDEAAYAPGSIDALIPKYHMTVWGLSVVFTVVPMLTDSYGDTGGWCWIHDDDAVSRAERFLLFYVPLSAVCLFNFVTYRRVRHKLAQQARDQGVDAAAASRMTRRMQYYPLVLPICYLFAFIHRLYQVIPGIPDQHFPLAVVHTLMASCVGLANALVYGLTPAVRKRVGQGCCGSGVPADDADDPSTRKSEAGGAGSVAGLPAAVVATQHKDRELSVVKVVSMLKTSDGDGGAAAVIVEAAEPSLEFADGDSRNGPQGDARMSSGDEGSNARADGASDGDDDGHNAYHTLSTRTGRSAAQRAIAATRKKRAEAAAAAAGRRDDDDGGAQSSNQGDDTDDSL